LVARADVAMFYRHDGQSIPSPRIIVMGKIGARASSATGKVMPRETDRVSLDLLDRRLVLLSQNAKGASAV